MWTRLGPLALAALLPWWVPVAGYAGWEAVQWWRFKADPWDCLLDWVAVCLGVCVAIALSADQGAAAACLALALILVHVLDCPLLLPEPPQVVAAREREAAASARDCARPSREGRGERRAGGKAGATFDEDGKPDRHLLQHTVPRFPSEPD